MVTGGRVGDLGQWLRKLGMLSFLSLVLVSLNAVVAERGMAQTKSNMEGYMLPLENCDFHFKGHNSVPPIFNLQNPGHNALSSNIITRDGIALRTAATAAQCLFPTGDRDDGGGVAVAEVAGACAEHFHMELDRLATRAAQANQTERLTKSLKGRHVVLPLTAVDLVDGTRLRAGDGNRRFPESRRCLSFFTASDISTVLDKVLNKAHRKKLSKMGVRAQRFRYDFNSLLNSLLQFP